MANNLTGDYEAVLQITVRQINGILATMHQNGGDKNASPSFPHSGSIRIGDRPITLGIEAVRFRDWVSKAVRDLRASTGSADNARAILSSKTPPGTLAMFQQAWDDLDRSVLAPAPTGRVRGRADFQVSTPTISVPAGSLSEVTVHAWVRAHFYPDSGALPEPIHGEVRARYVAKPRTLPDGRRILRVEVSPDDNQLEFLPAAGTGLSAAQVHEIAVQVRAALRKHFVPVDVALRNDFAFSEFKALGGGPTEAVVLPLQLSGAPVPPASLPSVTNHFLGSSEFAIAVSKEYAQKFFDALIGSMKTHAAAVDITVSGPLGTAHYSVSVSNIAVVWKTGAIEISGKIDLVTPTWWAPNGYITFTQAITVALDVASQAVSVKPVGEPQIDESWWLSHARAVNTVKSARDAAGALPAASANVSASFADALSKLATGLGSFDKSASVRYTAIEVTPDGIIVRGAIGTLWRFNPVVHYAETDGGTAVTAFQSWIPGGRIEQYDWTWVERTHVIPWFNKTKHVRHDHRFVCPKPADVYDANGVCLLIRGSRISPDGVLEPVEAGETCTNSSHEPILVHPSWWMKVMVPIWLPDQPDDFILSDILAGHVNVVGESRTPGRSTTNTLVHFTGSRMERSLEALSRALSQARQRDVPLQVVLVLPAGAFDARRSEVEARLGSPAERFDAHLVITEDYVGGWTSTFAAPDGPSTHFMNARGEFVWRQEGPVDAGALARALDEHAVAAPPSRAVPMRLSVEPGTAALDALFTDDRGEQVSLRRLRGRRVLLNFWQSWSMPCVRELQRLQREHEGRGGPQILAVNGGEDREVLADVRRRHGLTFSLIHDPGQPITTLYGVRCWPTTVSINEEGIVERVQFGLTHGHREISTWT
jgi:peroxiredoxin